jgi:two-component sensor histidine kinase
VSVRVRRLGDAVELAIADDGVGIPVDPRDDGDGMHSEAAPPEERSSLGMVLMRNLSTQLGTNLRIDSSSEGTVVTVRLPPDRVIE